MNVTTIVQISTGITVLSLFLLVAVLMLLGREGLYLLGRRLRPAGIDVLRYNRLSRSLTPVTIRWNGRLWEDGKTAKYFGLDVLKNPEEAGKQQYNRALQEAAQWAGCRRPVLLASDTVCFAYNVGFAELLSKKPNWLTGIFAKKPSPAQVAAPDTAEEEILDPDVKKVLDWLGAHWKDGYTTVDILTPIPHDTLSTYLTASTPDELSDTYDTAYGDGVRDATKPKRGLPLSPLQIAIGAGAIIAIIIAVVLVQRGAIKIPELPGAKAWWALLCGRAW